jgi:hypothetical protein
MRLRFLYTAIALTLAYSVIGCTPAHAELPQSTLALPQSTLAMNQPCPGPTGGKCTCAPGECNCAGACPGKAEAGHWSQFAGSPDYAFWTDSGRYAGRWFAASNTFVSVEGKSETIVGKQNGQGPAAQVAVSQAAPYYRVSGSMFANNCPGGNCH